MPRMGDCVFLVDFGEEVRRVGFGFRIFRTVP